MNSAVLNDDTALSAKRSRLLELLRTQQADKRKARVPRRDTSVPAPLSFAQQRLWFLDRLVPNSPFYNVPAAVRIRAPLNEDALRKTLNKIIERHEVLRTSFYERDGQPFQVVSPALEIPLPVRDLRSLDRVAREAAAIRFATEDAQQPFDLEKGPLIRASLLKLDDYDFVFLINLHHIVADGWSMGVLMEEFQRLYEAFGQNLPSPLPDLEIQYADFAAWQQKSLAAGLFQQQSKYWTEQLANLPLLELPTDFPHRDVQGFEGETLYRLIPRDVASELRSFSKRNQVTMFVTLFAAFNALLQRYTGQDEIVIGEPVANRNRIELEPLIGFFVNSLLLRTDVSGDPTFVELLARSRQVVLDADANQDIPFEVLVEQLKPERTMGRNPLFQVSLQYFTGGDVAGRYATLPAEIINVEKGTASLDLAFDLIDAADGIMARVEYSTELFRRETIERMISHYENLLREFLANPQLRLSEAKMLSSKETQEILSLGSTQPLTSPGFVPMPALFEAQVTRTPTQVAVECDGVELTYQQLDERVTRLAQVLKEKGIGPERVVAVCLHRSLETIVSLLAIWKAGGAYLPLDPSLPEERLRYLLDDARPSLVVTEPKFASILPVTQPVCFVSDTPSQATIENFAPMAGPENLAYVIYTSGSSGIPKGVMVEFGALSRHLQWMQTEFPLRADDRTLFKYSINFDVSILELLTPLIAGARLVVVEGDGPPDVSELAAIIHQRQITAIDLVPSLLGLLLDHPLFVAAPNLRRVICGGEVMPVDLARRLLDSKAVEFVNMYGPTETTITATYWRAGELNGKIPIGRPAANYSAHILDETLNPLPLGTPGELYLGGECLARGYLGLPDLTRRHFLHDPFSQNPGARLYRTGDRCRFLPDGNLEFLGRVDNQVKVRGNRIELSEVETALAGSPLVRACAVDVINEEDRTDLAAYVVPNTGEPEFWPSIGEYFVYDELLYHVMTSDRVRNRAYRSAIERTVRGKVVVDIGTGADLTLARMCIDAGAERVYAIEMLDTAYRKAESLVEKLGLNDRLILQHGDSLTVALPVKADVCVSELIGTIGSSEGVIEILNDARRFLRPGGAMIPGRCVTKIAAVSLPDDLMSRPQFSEIPRHYANKIFESVGRRFDLRLCVKNLPASCIVSDAAVFEDLKFDQPIESEQATEFRLAINRDCRVDGFLLWVNLYPASGDLIDVMTSECSWLPVFLPVFSTGIELKAKDVIAATAFRLKDKAGFTPDYLLRGVVVRSGAPRHDFEFESRRNEEAYAESEFYRRVHDCLESKTAPPRSAGGDEHQRVSNWRVLYDRLYATDPNARDRDFDVVGWNSSYTGQPIPIAEMREQVDATVARISALPGKDIFEIGCGTGLLLLPLAGNCRRYVGTDFSSSALAQVSGVVSERGWKHVELLERAADDFDGLTEESFDLIILNSVVQYFPSVHYLLRVIEGAVQRLRPSGCLFVGDVRSLPLLRLLHAGIELGRAKPGTTAGQLLKLIDQRTRHEPELVIDPDFFRSLPAHFSRISGVSIQVKRGWHHNELTQFRYDVTLQVEHEPTPLDTSVQVDWKTLGSTEALENYLRIESPSLLIVRDVPSARLGVEARALARLEQGDPKQSLADLALEQITDREGIEPELLWSVGNRVGYEIQVQWAESHDATRYDVICVSPSAAVTSPVTWDAGARLDYSRPWSAYANSAYRQMTHQDLAQKLRQYLHQKLPKHMVPSTFNWIDALPLTPTGKLDRRGLRLADFSNQRVAEDMYAPPETELHREIAKVWSAVLGIDPVGIDSNFFNIGGHSLLAMQVVSRLGDSLNFDMPLRWIFEKPTIRELAEVIAGSQSDAKGRKAPPLVAAKSADKMAIDLDRLTDAQVDELIHELLAKGGVVS